MCRFNFHFLILGFFHSSSCSLFSWLFCCSNIWEKSFKLEHGKSKKTDEWFRDEICFYVCLNVDVIWCSIPCHFMKHWVFDFGTNPSFNRRQYHSSCKLFIFSPHGQKCTQTDAHTHWRKLMRLAHKHRWTNDEASLIEQTLNEWRPSFCSFPLCSRCLWPSFIQENDSVMLLKYSSCDVSVTSFKA